MSERQRQRERQRDRETERQRDRQADRDRETERFCDITTSLCLLPWLQVQLAATVSATHYSTNKYTQFQSVGIGGNLNTSFRQYAQCRACAALRCTPVTHAHEPPARAPLPFHSSVFIEKEKLSLTNFIPLGTGSYLHCACLLPY